MSITKKRSCHTLPMISWMILTYLYKIQSDIIHWVIDVVQKIPVCFLLCIFLNQSILKLLAAVIICSLKLRFAVRRLPVPEAGPCCCESDAYWRNWIRTAPFEIRRTINLIAILFTLPVTGNVKLPSTTQLGCRWGIPLTHHSYKGTI
jgi:hypothetical protein